MIDLHTHTFFSDGVLGPSEHARRALQAGYRVLGITDHADFSNLEQIRDGMSRFRQDMEGCGWDIQLIPGVEITHVPASRMERIVTRARDLGIPLLIVHGETPVEPVEPGTNRAAIECNVDILAHPGLITETDVRLAAENNVSLEITARKGHSLTNGHVAKLALAQGAPLVCDTDAHAPGDFFTPRLRELVLLGAALDRDAISALEDNTRRLVDRLLTRL